jgi:toxin ParE1/3/4
MAFQVRLTEDAERDIEGIYRYVAGRDSIARAKRILDGLDRACAMLAALPRRGDVPKELRAVGIAEYREVHWKPYRIIYRIFGQQVVVACVLDGRQDMQSLLQRRLLR